MPQVPAQHLWPLPLPRLPAPEAPTLRCKRERQGNAAADIPSGACKCCENPNRLRGGTSRRGGFDTDPIPGGGKRLQQQGRKERKERRWVHLRRDGISWERELKVLIWLSRMNRSNNQHLEMSKFLLRWSHIKGWEPELSIFPSAGFTHYSVRIIKWGKHIYNYCCSGHFCSWKVMNSFHTACKTIPSFLKIT